MVKNLLVYHHKTYITKGIIPGVIIGGFVGVLIDLLIGIDILLISTLLGIVLGGLIGGLWALYSTGNINNAKYIPETSAPKQNFTNNVTLQIKEEQLDLAKKWMQTGEVKIFRESFIQEKSFTVPIKREELVIERKDFVSATPEHKVEPPNVIRIPLSEEQIEFIKHRVDLEDVSIYKQQIVDIKHIEETLKREDLKVKISGSPKVSDESNS
ncbi:YsnF/AvaK domain-containing protein [Desulfosporosinus meridiei]|uniref:Conserved domain protein, TIGR02271+C111 n=1 Tax=Desulfosporosinus meridiei (strain ATCC BAA-275 / DSM 13257 / KCTC 12902 / NCIMB 13706 / S10) TaxID=768704 RepID=J7IXB3_DESMD|nr:YsnF/AvaK domain-containing protein [Desulfosporosinus meridiei]AFQ43336.1 conserved domain protein, TIGR02271+C111 [Desulfosporosinus meridiei DSM 13257]